MADAPLAAGDPRVSLRWAPTIAAVTPDARAPEPDDLPPSLVDADSAFLGDLRELQVLGEGGMGRVVLAKQQSLHRNVAVKRAHVNCSLQLLREGVVQGMLEHPSIPPIHAVHRDPDGRVVLVMKCVEGVTWAHVLRDHTHPLRAESPLFTARDELGAHLEILIQVSNALEFAHSRGVIHRDIKPENVMLGPFGEVYLIDWGIAFHPEWERPDAAEGIVGTPLYMAPEMALGARPNARTDVYLLGATLFEVLTGSPPHHATTVHDALLRARAAQSPSFGPDVPSELAAICRRALAKEPSERFESMRALQSAVREFLSHRTSLDLCVEARKRTHELRAELAAAAPDPVRIAQLDSGCRFGFHQALRQWPENAEARAGLSELSRDLARYELRHGNARGARLHLAELADGDPTLEGAIEALEATLRERAEEERVRLEHVRGMDVRNSQRERTLLYAFCGAITLGISLYRTLVPVNELAIGARHQAMLTVWCGVVVVSWVGILVFSRTAFVAEINRRLVLLTVASQITVAANRVTGLVLLAPPAVTLAGDLAILSVATLVGALAVNRRLAWAALPTCAGLVATWLWPEQSSSIFNVAAGALLITVIVALRGGTLTTTAQTPASQTR